jgi:hypothetical protein
VAEDETALTEITILPDGRVYVFGMSQPVLEILGGLRPADPRLRRLLERVRSEATTAGGRRGPAAAAARARRPPRPTGKRA